MCDDEQHQNQTPAKSLKRSGRQPKLSDVVMLDRGCQLWIREARKGNITDTSKTLEKIRYQLRLERRVSGQSGSGLRRPVGRDKKPDTDGKERLITYKGAGGRCCQPAPFGIRPHNTGGIIVLSTEPHARHFYKETQ